MFQDFRLKVFVAAAQQKSFTKAAELLQVSQPAVSQNISELEKGLGFKLFERLKGEVVLTSEGEVFMNYALGLLDYSSMVETLFTKLEPSDIAVCVSEEIYTYYIKDALDHFSAVHPGITFERVDDEDADICICLSPSSQYPFDIAPEVISKVCISMSPVQNKSGDVYATRQRNSYFNLLFKPSQAFASTKTCQVLKDYLASLL